MTQNGNGAWQNLHTFAHGFVEDNGFHVNGDFRHYGYSIFHYRPFTLESSFGFCDALHEMLLQDHMGYIHLFPAIPDEWKDREIFFTDLRSRGGVLVSSVHNTDGLCTARFRSERKQTVRLKNTFGDDTAFMTIGDTQTVLKAEDGMFTFTLLAGAVAVIRKYAR